MAAESIRTARKPLIFVGNNAVHYASSQVITKFAEKLHIPVVNTMMAKGIRRIIGAVLCNRSQNLFLLFCCNHIRLLL